MHAGCISAYAGLWHIGICRTLTYRHMHRQSMPKSAYAGLWHIGICRTLAAAYRHMHAGLRHLHIGICMQDFGICISVYACKTLTGAYRPAYRIYVQDFDYSWLVDEIKHNLPQELDFTLEAANAERCRINIASGQLKGRVYVPQVCSCGSEAAALLCGGCAPCYLSNGRDACQGSGLACLIWFIFGCCLPPPPPAPAPLTAPPTCSPT